MDDALSAVQQEIAAAVEAGERDQTRAPVLQALDAYWKSDPNYEAMKDNILRSLWPGYPGPITPAAVEAEAQYILCDMAGRVVTGGLPIEAALKEAHKRIEDIHRLRSRG